MWIMIAGPYRTGAHSAAERQHHLDALNRAALEVFRKGHVPMIGVNAALPLIEAAGADTYDAIMMPLSLSLAERCDAVLRLDGISPGADLEVERIKARGGVVYRSLADIPDVSQRRGAQTQR
jgi:hypothetical protein